MRTRILAFLMAAPLHPQQEASVAFHGATLHYLHAPAASQTPAPLVLALPGGDATPENARELLAAWQRIVAPHGWRVAVALLHAGTDSGAKALETLAADAAQRLHADPARIYLAGAGAAVPEVFYALSRLPGAFAAACAIQGNPAPAINTNHLYGANTSKAPLLWVSPAAFARRSLDRLTRAQFQVETRGQATDAQILDWLAQHRRDPFPAEVDCETGSPAFARCYWIEMTKFDPRRRNDALESSRVQPGSGASLALGGFGFDPAAPGPGVTITWLPPDANGPLRLNDRLVAIAGRPIQDAADYIAYMDEEVKEEKAVAVTAERGKERLRLETRSVLPKRDELITARVRGQYTADPKEILVVSRTVSEMRLTIPAEWAPAQLSWNGIDFKVEGPGCWRLSAVKEPPEISRCEAVP